MKPIKAYVAKSLGCKCSRPYATIGPAERYMSENNHLGKEWEIIELTEIPSGSIVLSTEEYQEITEKMNELSEKVRVGGLSFLKKLGK